MARTTILAALLFAFASSAVAQTSSDLSVTKTGPLDAPRNTNVFYTVTVSNLGPNAAGTVTVTDPIPADMTFVSATPPSGFTCTTPAVGATGTITCTGASLNAGASVDFTFAMHIDGDAELGTTITNAATAATSTDSNPGNNTGTADTVIIAVSDLQVTKTGPATAAADTDVAYQVTVTNAGPDVAEGVSLDDNIPPGMTFVSATIDPDFVCSTPTPGDPGSVNCDAQTLAAGDTATFTFVFHIDPAAVPGTSFTNIATVFAESDFDEENNTASATTTIPPPPVSDMFVTKSGPPAAAADSDVTYTIVVSNGGPGAADNATLTDTIPGTATFVSLSQTGTNFPCTTPAVGAGGTIQCDAVSYPAGSTTLTLTIHIPAGTEEGTEFTNAVFVGADNDANEENNTASTTLLISSADLSIVKSGPATVAAGSNVSYVITVTNNGPNTAIDARFDDVLPPNTTFVSVVQNNGPAAGCDRAGNTVFCQTAFLASGASMQFTLTITAGNTASINNTAVASSPSVDPDTSNNSSSVTTAVTPVSDLGIVKSGPASANAGANITYTLTATNSGPSNAANVRISDVLPAGTTFVSVTQNSGPTFTCGNVANTVECNIATFPVDVTATFTVVANISSGATGTISNTATITSLDVTNSDPDATDNSSTVVTTLTFSADLAITKNAPAAVVSGQSITFTVSATNNGPSNATNVTLTDTLPATTTFVSANQTAGPTFTCAHAAGTITCTAATLVAGATATFDFVATVTSEGPLVNTATISSTTPDPATANNSATSNSNASRAPADLSIMKTVNAPTPVPGAPATFTIVVSNAGPGPAADVVVTDVLPAGVTLVSATSTQGACTGTTTVVCTVGTLNAAASATITLDVRLPLTPGPVTNTATVTSSDADPNAGNNASTATINSGTVAGIPTLSEWALMLLAAMIAAAAVKLLKA